MTALDFWTSKHEKYATERFVLEPNRFAIEVAGVLAPGSRILDLGCGQGQDARHFARLGHDVVACDFAPAALARFTEAAHDLGIRQQVLDLADVPYPFADREFDVVYSHLAAHYFDQETTCQVFAEIARVIAPSGRFFAYLNSVHDPEVGTGRELEPRYEEFESGNRKRYFTTDELPQLLGSAFDVASARYGIGTTKNGNDRWVRLEAIRNQEATTS